MQAGDEGCKGVCEAKGLPGRGSTGRGTWAGDDSGGNSYHLLHTPPRSRELCTPGLRGGGCLKRPSDRIKGGGCSKQPLYRA